MTGEDGPPPGDITERITEEVVPIYEYVLAHVAMDQEARDVVRAGLIKATWAGARIGSHEVVAQLIEQGFDPGFSISLPDPSWEELLEPDE